MFSFELSAFDLVLSVGVIVLIVLFVTTILKLNPSGENKGSKNENVYEEERELDTSTRDLSQLDKADMPLISSHGAERAASAKLQQPPQLTVSATTGGPSQVSLEQTSQPLGYKESPKHKRSGIQKQAAKSSEENDCFHFFGYLGGLPKNTPIPGECFGCQRIVDCLITPKQKP